MNYYPVVIPTLCRFEHFKRCVESLAKNTHAKNTELIIGLDYPARKEHWDGYKKICNYLTEIEGFKEITIIKHDANIGAIKNLNTIRDYAYKKYDAIILSEDDNEFSPCFLDYMNRSLMKYANYPNIVSVSGYTTTCYTNISKYKTIFTYDSSAWGIGLWKNKQETYDKDCYSLIIPLKSFWKIYKTFPACILMFLYMIKSNTIFEDTIKTAKNIIEKRYQLRPSVSMVRNWGIDGTGIHCGIDDSFSRQEIQKATIFEIDDRPIEVENKINKKTFYVCLPTNKFKAWRTIIKTGILYLKYKFLKKI